MGLALDKGDQPGLNPSIPPCISGHSQQVHRSQDTKYYVIHSIETQKQISKQSLLVVTNFFCVYLSFLRLAG